MVQSTGLVIVGGGPACAALLDTLARKFSVPKLKSIVVLEQTAHLGPGLPYGEAAHPQHSLGRIVVRRRARGADFSKRISQAVARLQSAGVTVDLRTECTARTLQQVGDAWRLETSQGELFAQNVVLACGHWNVPVLPKHPRILHWKFDIRALEQVQDGSVTILGTGQSGNDVALTLLWNRSFRGNITLASRRGIAPLVWGHIDDERFSEALLAKDQQRAPRLSDVLAAMKRRVEQLGGTWCDPLDNDSLHGEGGTRLRNSLEEALESKRNRQSIPWQQAVFRTVPEVFQWFPLLPAEDRLVLAKNWYPLMRIMEGMHHEAARQLLHAESIGRLQWSALGETPRIEIEGDELWVRSTSVAHRSTWVIDARGMNPRIENSDHSFLSSIFKERTVESAQIPFLSSTATVEVPQPFSLRSEQGKRYLETGGIWIDPATFLVRTHLQGYQNLYAMGPLCIGQLPLYLGLWALREESKTIVRSLAERFR